jgi:hypothetical protein
VTISAVGRSGRYILFGFIALTINLVDRALVRSIPHPGYRTLVAIAATVDIVAMVAAIYYWLLVRPGIRKRWSVAPVAVAGLLHATYLFPNAGAARGIVAGLCEAGLAGFLITQLRRSHRGAAHHPDPVDAIRDGLAAAVPIPPVANLLATELAVLYYALFSWRARPHIPPGAAAFSMHKRGGQADILFALAIATLVELVPVHLLLHHWSPVSAWIVSGLTAYGAIWLAGLARSIELRPSLVAGDYLDIRFGLLFGLKIPRSAILEVRPAKDMHAAVDMVLPRRSEPNLCIRLAAPLIAEMLFGLRKRIGSVALAVDDTAGFQQALERMITGA